VAVSIDQAPIVPAAQDAQDSLRERKKDATRRALAEAAMTLAAERGYAEVTIADITAAVGVSRRTFSNYFPGKAECVAAVADGWFDDILLSFEQAPAGCPLDALVLDVLSSFADALPDRWEKLCLLTNAEPELHAMVESADLVNVERLTQVIARRVGLPAGDIRLRMVSTFALIAGRTCLEEWVVAGRPGGPAGMQQQLGLALSIIDLDALAAPGTITGPRGTDDPAAQR
jgi:AcrR family transcriptional regulator